MTAAHSRTTRSLSIVLLHASLVISLTAGVHATATPQVLFNEYLAANQFDIVDEDGDHEDWIELFNAGPDSADLCGYGLSDDLQELFLWVMPSVQMPPGGFLLLYASDKDRAIPANHWETVIDQGDDWRYRIGNSEPPADWRQVGFDDSGWEVGPTGIGYGDGDDETIIAPTISVYMRKKFTVSDPNTITAICLNMDYDDAFVAYLNDVEIGRAGIGEPGDHPAHNQTASTAHEAVMYRGLPPERFYDLVDPCQVLEVGDNVLAIQVHNHLLDQGDMSAIPFLTLGMSVIPAHPAGAPAILPLPRLHTNFKIDPDGETLSLCTAAGVPLDQIDTGSMVADISRGRQPDGGHGWYFFNETTPGTTNIATAFPGFAESPDFSPARGFFPTSTMLSLDCATPGATIRYSLDGAEPTTDSARFTSPLPIDTTTVVRARAFASGLLPSRIISHTYLINEEVSLPVVSLTTDPPNLWDWETGIYVMGPGASPDPPHHGANFYQNWERPVHMEYFEVSGQPGFNLDAGIKIHGYWSRQWPQKSFRILARSEYGTSWIDYPIFAERELTEFKRLVLRNSGTDWCKAHFRDALAHRLATEADLPREAYTPSMVFLNGVYWGILNIRERLDKYYLSTHYGVGAEAIDFLESNRRVLEGDALHYDEMLDFIEHHDLSLDPNFQVVQTYMDTDQFAEYCIFEIQLVNTDWPAANIRYWRPRTPDGRWRWLLHDLDMGLFRVQSYTFNALERATDPEGPGGQYPWATFLLRSLLDNEGFRHSFINRYADHLNTTFEPDHMHAYLESVRLPLVTEAIRHFARWETWIGTWYHHIDRIEEFIDNRPSYARFHLMTKFGLPGTLRLNLDVEPHATGGIALTAVTIDSTWTGTYFQAVPIPVTAVPAYGYRFAHWSDPDLPPAPSVVLSPTGDYSLIAYFEPDSGSVVVNEINYHSAPQFDPEDWIELHSTAAHEIDISGWELKDSEPSHSFTFAGGTSIAAGAYLVVCRDLAAFQAAFPWVTNVVGELGFGLAGSGDVVWLRDEAGETIDWVEYSDDPPWPPEPDGHGPTLELIDPLLDNSLASSWAASLASHGTPGGLNSVAGGITALDGGPGLALEFALSPAFPNPFNPYATISFTLPRHAQVRLSIYDGLGRRVRLITDGPLEPGHHRSVWDGRDDRGRHVASGVYFNELIAGDQVVRGKLVLLR
jgi:hypothetical protein